MPVTVSWFDPEQTILRFDLEGKWTWDEFYPAFDESVRMSNTVRHRIDSIVDLTRSNGMPNNALTHLAKIADRQVSHAGFSVLVTKNTFMIALFNAGTRFYHRITHYFRVAGSVEDGLAMIKQSRESMIEILPPMG